MISEEGKSTMPYHYSVRRLLNAYEQAQQRPKLMPTDEFKFYFNVVSCSLNSSNPVRCIRTLLNHRNEIGSRMFFIEEKGQDFLRSNLFHKDLPNEWCEEIIQSVVPQVRGMFEFDDQSFVVVADGDHGNSNGHPQSRQFLLQLEIILMD